ncbi:hypothetical protein [Frankia sp. AgB32]|nr:hypothetical protein [Frankia sp. AgB32]MCK9898443.1 hypothetical protein [Frankia sp. AgB32]
MTGANFGTRWGTGAEHDDAGRILDRFAAEQRAVALGGAPESFRTYLPVA